MLNRALIKEILGQYHNLAPATFSEFFEMLEMVEVPKGDDFIIRGKQDEFEYIVLDGVCRSYLLNPEGEEVTVAFFSGKSILSPYISRTQRGLSTLNYQALTDVRLARFRAKEFEEFMVVNLEIRAWGNEALKRELALKVEREIQLASLNAKGRLLKFREQFPLLENLVPHPAIASYLGITNVSLSRLRKETL